MGYGVVLVQLGSPRSPSVKDVRRYLKRFLSDPRVVDSNPLLWKVVLNLIVLPLRPKRSAQLYSRIWNGSQFPLIQYTESLVAKINAIHQQKCTYVAAYVIDEAGNSIDKALEVCRKRACDEIIFIPMFPQYAEATTASVIDSIFYTLKMKQWIPTFRVLSDFHDSKDYISACVSLIRDSLQKNPRTDALLFSFHGYPLRRIQTKNDPYLCHSEKTFQLLCEELLKNNSSTLRRSDIAICFQSKFGREPWLVPTIEETLQQMVAKGKKHISIFCPGFAADCLETIDEIGHELKLFFQNLVQGSTDYTLTLIPCLNDSAVWVDAIHRMVDSLIQSRHIERLETQSRFCTIGQTIHCVKKHEAHT